MPKEKIKVYLYTRVSTAMQIDEYSLEAQKTKMKALVDNVQIYEERKENGQWLKSIEFKLPIIEKEFTLSLDNDAQNETVVGLHRKDMQKSLNLRTLQSFSVSTKLVKITGKKIL